MQGAGARYQSKPLAQCRKLKKAGGGGQKKSGRWGGQLKQDGGAGNKIRVV